MSENKPKLIYNIDFCKEQEYSVGDIRFTKVKIWLMHLGINHNGSSFSREVVENAIPTLANVPILGYIEKNSEGTDDFSDHRYELLYEEEGIKYVYKGSAYGLIPENNNAHFEKKICEDGETREFLVVDGLIWNKLSDGTDILNRDLWKYQSMELLDDENYYDGEFDNDGIYHFKKFSFYGACFLGNGVEPAMEDAKIELAFSKIKADIYDKLKIFYDFMNKEGGNTMQEENTENIEKNEELNVKTEDNLVELDSKELDNSANDKSEIDRLKSELFDKDKELEKIRKEYKAYKEKAEEEKHLLELEGKKELLKEYSEILKDDEEYKNLVELYSDEKEFSKISSDDLRKELNSIFGSKVKKEFAQKKEEYSNSRIYFEDNLEKNKDSFYGKLIDDVVKQ